jgi:amidase
MSTLDQICLQSATEQAALIRAGELSSRQLLDAYAERVEALNAPLNAICRLDLERAGELADEADRAGLRGDWRGPLHGLPVTVKDAIETAGIVSTGGAKELADHLPAHDAPAVAALKRAGAIVFGKTNLSEWSGDVQAFNDLFGVTNNPWDLSRTPGGSSGGAAAAVAAGLTSFELGTDIGGSIRIPSAFCGVFGHKPSFGLVPAFGYLDAVGGGLTESDVNCFGPIARSAADLDLLLGVLAGPVPERALAWSVELPWPDSFDVSGLRVAAWLDDPLIEVDSEVVAVYRRAADALEAAGARVDRSARPAIDVGGAALLGGELVEVAASVGMPDTALAALAARPDGPLHQVQMSHIQWLRRDRQRAVIRQQWATFFERWDVLLCPVTLVPAFQHILDGSFASRVISVNGRQRRYEELCTWPCLIGSAYLPSTAAPVGFTAAGLPVGIQVVGPFLHDRTTIAVAGWLSALTNGYQTPPSTK